MSNKYSQRIYTMVADILGEELKFGGDSDTLFDVYQNFDSLFKRDNPAYKPHLFRKACGWTENRKARA